MEAEEKIDELRKLFGKKRKNNKDIMKSKKGGKIFAKKQ